MKKIGKLNINPERVIKNEELTALRGGYGSGECCECHTLLGETKYAVNSTPDTCPDDCYKQFYGWGTWECIV